MVSGGIGALRNNPAYLAMVAELNKLQIPHRVEDGGAHPHLVFEFRGRKFTHPVSLNPKRGVPQQAARDIKRMIQEAEAVPRKAIGQIDAEGTMKTDAATSVSLIGLHVAVDGPRVRDTDIGERLGLIRPEKVRHNLIERNMSELRRFGEVVRVEDNIPMPKGGTKPGFYYLLNEQQALQICILSRAPKAADVREMLIRVYVAWRHAHQPAPAIGTEGGELSRETLTVIGGIVKSVVGKLLEDANAGNELLHLEVEKINSRLNRLESSGGGRTSSRPDIGYVTAFEVVSILAEVPADRRYQGLTSWVTGQLLRKCADAQQIPRQVQTYPGTKWSFPEDIVSNWLSDGGRAGIWSRVEQKRAAKIGQGTLNLTGGQQETRRQA